MNENAKKWVEALRSGKYEQASNALRSGNAYCCLGVACEISGIGEWDSDDRVSYAAYLEETGKLPARVMDWLGIRDDVGGYNNGDNCLTDDNDNGRSFTQIANIIEKYQDELFVR
jgi:hypothetical protein